PQRRPASEAQAASGGVGEIRDGETGTDSEGRAATRRAMSVEDLKQQQEERRRKARLAATDPVGKVAKVLGVRASDDLRGRVELDRMFVERLKENRVPGVIRTKPERRAMERFYNALLELRRAAKPAELKYHLLSELKHHLLSELEYHLLFM